MFEPIGTVSKVVIHHSTEDFSGAVAANAHALHLKGKAKGYGAISYHYVIGNGVKGYHDLGGAKVWAESADGGIEVGRPLEIKGVHATPNEGAIGIVLVGNFNRSKPTEKQMRALENLVLYLIYKFKLTPSDVVGHREHQQTDKKCPGANFDMEAFRRSLKMRFNSGDTVHIAMVSKRVESLIRSSAQTLREQMTVPVFAAHDAPSVPSVQ